MPRHNFRPVAIQQAGPRPGTGLGGSKIDSYRRSNVFVVISFHQCSLLPVSDLPVVMVQLLLNWLLHITTVEISNNKFITTYYCNYYLLLLFDYCVLLQGQLGPTSLQISKVQLLLAAVA